MFWSPAVTTFSVVCAAAGSGRAAASVAAATAVKSFRVRICFSFGGGESTGAACMAPPSSVEQQQGFRTDGDAHCSPLIARRSVLDPHFVVAGADAIAI